MPSAKLGGVASSSPFNTIPKIYGGRMALPAVDLLFYAHFLLFSRDIL